MHRVRTRAGLVVAAAASCSAGLAVFASSAAAEAPQPVITRSPAPDPGNNTSPTWAFSLSGGGPLSCRLTGPAGFEVPYVACEGSMTYDLAGRPDGTYTFAVRRQPAPSSSQEPPTTSTYVLDTRAPVTITSAPSSPSNQSVARWSFTAEPGATFECGLGLVGQSAPTPTTCTSGQSFTLPSDGTFTFSVQATDVLGNTGPPATSTYTLHRVAPAAPLIGTGPTSPGSDTMPTWTFTTEAATTTECLIENGALVVAGWEPCSGSYSYRILDDSGAGTYVFSVRSRDTAGNTSRASSAVYDFRPAATEAPASAGAPPAAGPTEPASKHSGGDPEPADEPEPAGKAEPTGKAEPDTGRPATDATDPAPGGSGERATPKGEGSTTGTTGAKPSGSPAPASRHGRARAATVVLDASTSTTPAATPVAAASLLAASVIAEADETVTRSGAVAVSSKVRLIPTGHLGTGKKPGQLAEMKGSLPAPSELNATDELAGPPSLLPNHGGTGVAEAILKVGAATVKKSAFPLLLLVIVFLFLLVQNRIDRRDPKLALAPVYGDPDLSFTPPPSRHRAP